MWTQIAQQKWIWMEARQQHIALAVWSRHCTQTWTEIGHSKFHGILDSVAKTPNFPRPICDEVIHPAAKP
jgi:hypothetical protein